MPKIDPPEWTSHVGAPHSISGQNDGPYADIGLGDCAGLTQFGVRLERLPPGSRSAHRHWHAAEDEFLLVLSGELILIEEVETQLVAGDAAGWRAGVAVAHCLENRADKGATYLVVGHRAAADVVHYPDNDVVMTRKGDERRFARTNGDDIEPLESSGAGNENRTRN